MSAAAADIRKIIQIAATAAAGLLALAASQAPSRAQTSHMLVIPASDGYGFDDCLADSKACGQVIADAWCEAHGMASSVSFGRADDITASVANGGTPASAGMVAASSKYDPGTFIVNCRD